MVEPFSPLSGGGADTWCLPDNNHYPRRNTFCNSRLTWGFRQNAWSEAQKKF